MVAWDNLKSIHKILLPVYDIHSLRFLHSDRGANQLMLLNCQYQYLLCNVSRSISHSDHNSYLS